MFRRIAEPAGRSITIHVDDDAVSAIEGDTVAAALLASGHDTFRLSVVDAAPRGPYCLMGACFECLVEIDGVPDRQACVVPVRPGMRIRRRIGAAP